MTAMKFLSRTGLLAVAEWKRDLDCCAIGAAKRDHGSAVGREREARNLDSQSEQGRRPQEGNQVAGHRHNSSTLH